jgi:flagellar protein FliS
MSSSRADAPSITRLIPSSLPPIHQEPSLATYAGNKTDAYKQQSILTAPPGRLVVMLYDGCLRFLFQSAYAMREGNRAQAQDRMRRAEAIIDELTCTLDHERGGEIASRLQGIYAFCRRHLIEAMTENDPGKVEEVSELLSELREAWAEIAGA